MSSSVKMPGWEVFAERLASPEFSFFSPSSEMSALLQKYFGEVNAAQRAIEEAQLTSLSLLAQQAVFVIQLATALEQYETVLIEASLNRIHRHLRVLKDQMLSHLHQANLEVIVPLGQPFEAVANLVQVDGWRHRESLSTEVVDEVIEPIVMSRGVLVRQGRVVMGAPIAPDKRSSGQSLSETY